MHTALDDSELSRFRHDLVEQIGQYRSTGVIIDVAALDVIDSFAFTTLGSIARIAPLRGAATVIVGIQPDVALAIASMGMGVGSVATALDLEDGVEYLDRRTGRQ